MAKKIWNLMFVAGNPTMFDRVISNADNPMQRQAALDGAAHITQNSCKGDSPPPGWRVWIEHAHTGERIFESAAEIAHREAREAAAKGVGAQSATLPADFAAVPS